MRKTLGVCFERDLTRTTGSENCVLTVYSNQQYCKRRTNSNAVELTINSISKNDSYVL